MIAFLPSVSACTNRYRAECKWSGKHQPGHTTDEMAYPICIWRVCVAFFSDSCKTYAKLVDFRAGDMVQALSILFVAYMQSRLTPWGCRVQGESVQQFRNAFA